MLYMLEPARFTTKLNHLHSMRYTVLEAIDLLSLTERRDFKVTRDQRFSAKTTSIT